jgi:hypothetical protein
MCERYNNNVVDILLEPKLTNFSLGYETASSSFERIVINERVGEDLRRGVGRYLETRNRLLQKGTPPYNIFTILPGFSDAMLFDNLIVRGYASDRADLLPESTILRFRNYGPSLASVCSTLWSPAYYSQESQAEFVETYERYKTKEEFVEKAEELKLLIDLREEETPLAFAIVIDYESTGHTNFLTGATVFHACELSKRPPEFDFADFVEKFHFPLFSAETRDQVAVVDLRNNVRLARVVLGGSRTSWIESVIDTSFYDLLHHREKIIALVKPFLKSVLRGGYKTDEGEFREIKTEEDLYYVGREISRPRPYKKETENPAEIIRTYCRERGISFLSLLKLHQELEERMRGLGRNIDF